MVLASEDIQTVTDVLLKGIFDLNDQHVAVRLLMTQGKRLC
jgi:hypothetical protein